MYHTDPNRIISGPFIVEIQTFCPFLFPEHDHFSDCPSGGGEAFSLIEERTLGGVPLREHDGDPAASATNPALLHLLAGGQ